eukprot:Gb_21091 [translate_table: standard]
MPAGDGKRDFGLAKFLQDSGASECMSSIAGSYGYIVPVFKICIHSDFLRVDEESDVYSFGVVLLELITSRRPVREFRDGVDIVQWVRKVTNSVKEGVLNVLDSRLSTIPLHEVVHVSMWPMLCVEEQCRKANHEEGCPAAYPKEIKKHSLSSPQICSACKVIWGLSSERYNYNSLYKRSLN